MGAPMIQVPTMTYGTASGPSSPRIVLDSPKRPDMTDSNVKRARLLLEKKKKQFE